MRDQEYMKLAINLAKSAKGQTQPNPMVGAVIVKDGQIVGMGAHLKAGQAHAEVHALRMAADKARGATMYVTLEPCSHYGRTPPCADQVLEAGLSRVMVATLDPNPLVAGRGVEKLKQAGIEVQVGLLAEESVQMNEVFNHYIVHQRPFVTLKMATTLDGKIATATGESQWITGAEARADVHQLRKEQQAILVGVQTVISDNPQLTARTSDVSARQPIRIILDSSLRTPLTSQILDISVAETWIVITQQVTEEKMQPYLERGVKLFQTKDSQRVSLDELLRIVGEQQVSSLLVEGGGEVNASFLQEKKVEKIILYLAPMLIGGNEAPSSFRGVGFPSLAAALRLKRVCYESIGQDLKVTGYPEQGVSE